MDYLKMMNNTKHKEFKRGEIWRFNPDPTMGREQSKVRPCLILSSNQFNNSPADLLIIVPMTSKNRGIPSHIEIKVTGLKNTSYILCEQIRSVSKMRMYDLIGCVENKTLKQVEYWVSIFLDLATNGK